MLEKLLERMKLMDETIAKQQQAVAQVMADMNMLNGCKQELQHIINMAKEAAEAPAACVDPNCNSVSDLNGEVVA